MGTTDGLADHYDARFDDIARRFVASCLAARENYSKRLLDIDAQRNAERSINAKALDRDILGGPADNIVYRNAVTTAEYVFTETQSRTSYTVESANAAAQLKRDVQSAADVAAREALRAL